MYLCTKKYKIYILKIKLKKSNEEYIAGGTDKGLITVIEHKKTNPGAFIILGLNSELKNQGQISGLDIGYHNIRRESLRFSI